jgi:hypothetical protein
MEKLADGSMVFSTQVHMGWRDRSLHALTREAVVPNPQTASYLKFVLMNSNEMLEGTLISHDVETGVFLEHLSTAPNPSTAPQEKSWTAEQILPQGLSR